MAKEYRAVNQIRFGLGDGEEKVFNPGDAVTGLSVDQMKELWAAGVLSEYDPDAQPRDARDDEIERLKAQIAALEADRATAQESPPPPGTSTLPENPTPTSAAAAAALVGTVGDPASPGPAEEGTADSPPPPTTETPESSGSSTEPAP